MDNGKSLLVQYEGKNWIRLGECNRCGECCLGWGIGPCKHLIYDSYSYTHCDIYDKRKEIGKTEQGINLEGCLKFPAFPGDLMRPEFRNKCGFFFIQAPKILVACPTYVGKEYCAEKWLNAVKFFDYPFYDILWVDNSDTLDFYNRWKDKITIHRLDLRGETPQRHIALSMDHIRKHFLEYDYDNWLNLEADVIAPPNTLKRMLEIDKGNQFDWLGLGYPCRITGKPSIAAFGCTMFSRKIMIRYTFDDCPADQWTDGWWWHKKIQPDTSLTVMEGWGILPLEHLNG